MKRVLVPTDFSDQSICAISSAASLSAKMDVELVILHVVSEEEEPVQKQYSLEEIFTLPQLKNVRHYYKQLEGEPVDCILAEKADLIVMGSKGAHGVESLLVGTYAEKVAKHASCPVFVVKRACDFSCIKSIVFPTNMKREDEDALDDLKALQELFGARLFLLKVFDDSVIDPEEVEGRLRDFARFHQLTNYNVAARSGADESEVIDEYTSSINADLVAMVTHNRNGLDRLFGGHISGQVINTLPKPVWVKSLAAEV